LPEPAPVWPERTSGTCGDGLRAVHPQLAEAGDLYGSTGDRDFRTDQAGADQHLVEPYTSLGSGVVRAGRLPRRSAPTPQQGAARAHVRGRGATGVGPAVGRGQHGLARRSSPHSRRKSVFRSCGSRTRHGCSRADALSLLLARRAQRRDRSSSHSSPTRAYSPAESEPPHSDPH
jgi:hypothetical protein